MSLNYVSANSLNNSIDRLSDLVSYTVPPIPPRTAKTLTLNNMSTSVVAGSPVSGQSSLVFNGSNTYIEIENAAADWAATANNSTDGGTNGKLQFYKQGQLTVEFSIYLNSTSGAGFIEWGANGVAIGYSVGNGWYWATSGITFGLTWNPGSVSTGTWYQIAFTRTWASGGDPTYTLYVNGVSQGGKTSSTTYTGTNPFGTGVSTPYIGGGNSGPGFIMNGYLQEIRISNIARYSGNYTPATTPFVNDTNTLLLLHGTSPIVDDNS